MHRPTNITMYEVCSISVTSSVNAQVSTCQCPSPYYKRQIQKMLRADMGRHAKVGKERCARTAGSRLGGSRAGILGKRAANPYTPTRWSGERCKLPEWGLGHSPSQNRIWCILALKSDIWWQKFLRFS